VVPGDRLEGAIEGLGSIALTIAPKRMPAGGAP
jgi:hypothetical protein